MVFADGAEAAKARGEGVLAGGLVGFNIAQVVDDDDRGGDAGDRDGGDDGQPGEIAGLDIGRASDPDQAEEDEDKDLTQTVIAERVGSAGVCDGADDGEEAEDQHWPAATIDEVEASNQGEGDGQADCGQHLSIGDEAGVHHPERTDPLLVGALLVIEVVVGEVAGDLEEDGDQERDDGGWPVFTIFVVGDGGPDQDGRNGREEGFGADGMQPDLEWREIGIHRGEVWGIG